MLIDKKRHRASVCLQYLKEHYEKHGTINDITYKSVVFIDGDTVNIGRFLESVRINHRKFLSSSSKGGFNDEVMLLNYKVLDDMGFIWEPNLKKSSMKRDLYIDYLREHYREYGTINDITANFVVTYQGFELKVGEFLRKIAASYKNGSISSSDLFFKRCSELQEMGFDFLRKSSKTIRDIALDNDVDLEDLKKLMTRFDGNMDKALKITLANKRSKERREVAEDFTVGQFLDEFSLDIDSLKRLLKDTTIVIGDGNNVYSDDMLLRDFCTKNGYDYNLVSLMIKIKRDGLDSNDLLLASYTNCVYGKTALLKSILEYASISPRSVVDEMKNNGILVDQALINVCFRKKAGRNFDYLRGIFYDYVKAYNNLFKTGNTNPCSQEMEVFTDEITSYYGLDSSERKILDETFIYYNSVIHRFHLADVAFEGDDTKRGIKIMNYQLDEDDMEHAFLLPLEFNQYKLLGEYRRIYNRKKTLSTLIPDFKYMSVDGKRLTVEKYKLSLEELFYIDSLSNKQQTNTIDTKRLTYK